MYVAYSTRGGYCVYKLNANEDTLGGLNKFNISMADRFVRV